jgi:hypothetical protein
MTESRCIAYGNIVLHWQRIMKLVAQYVGRAQVLLQPLAQMHCREHPTPTDSSPLLVPEAPLLAQSSKS